MTIPKRPLAERLRADAPDIITDLPTAVYQLGHAAAV
jgi:hypothetical protein